TPDKVTPIIIPIPKIEKLMLYRGKTALDFSKPLVLPNNKPFMLPAIHTSTINVLPDTLPSAIGNGGKIYRRAVDALTSVQIPGNGGIRSAIANPGDYVGCDGHVFWLARKDGAKNSFYATPFEEDLFMFAVNDKMFLPSRELMVSFAIRAQLINADSNARWVARIDRGTAPSDDAPDPVGYNLKDILWNDTPVLEFPITLTPELQMHSFGVNIRRNVDNTMACSKQLYGQWLGNDANAPVDANFALRGRMVNLDTEDSRPFSRGWIYYQMLAAPGVDGTPSGDEIQAIIK
ncbi:MAG: hypothetical protein ABI615_10415, partial [Chthoniobacterales bacterium]